MPSSSTLLCLIKLEYHECDQPRWQKRGLCSKIKITDGKLVPSHHMWYNLFPRTPTMIIFWELLPFPKGRKELTESCCVLTGINN